MKLVYFPLSHYIAYFSKELQRVSATPIYELILSNNNIYGLLILLIFEKHVEQEEIRLIPEYFHRQW